MNHAALLALLLSAALGDLLLRLGWASPLTHFLAGVGIAGTLGLLLLGLVALLRRIPRRGRMVLALLIAPLALRGAYFFLRHHWLTPGVFVILLLAAIALLWPVRLHLPLRSRKTGIALAALCGLGVPLLWSSVPPRTLLQGVKRWRSEPLTRTPLGIAAHTGLLGSLGLFPLMGLISLRSGSGQSARGSAAPSATLP
jgi:hypothetical protein